MKVLARGIIYVACSVAGGVCICQPLLQITSAGVSDVGGMIRWFALGFGLVFAGCELSEALKRHWGRKT